MLNDVYNQVAKLLDSIYLLKRDSDEKSEIDETQQVPSDAANDFKQRLGVSFVSDKADMDAKLEREYSFELK